MKQKNETNVIKQKGSKRKIVYSLNWNAQLYEDRLACVEELRASGRLDDLSPAQLNEVSNYLLYSSDVDCAVELKKPTKKSLSYEEMVENGVADMAINNAKNRSIYKTYKPSIDREKDADIPGMKDLWEAIEGVKKVYDYLDDCLKGRREKDISNPLEITYAKHFYYKNWYIDLCLNQYVLKDSYRPVMQSKYPDTLEWKADRDEVDFGIAIDEYIYYEGNSDKVINLADPVQIYPLIKNYRFIREQHLDDIGSGWNMLYDLIDEAIDRCNFNDCIWDILEMKINGEQNAIIGDKIREKYNVSYNDNYISTLFTKSISKKIAKAAVINSKRIQKETGKHICPKCKNERWNDEFYSFAKACGYCLKKMKEEKKKIKLWR